MENLLKTTQLRRTYVIEYAKNTAKMRPKWLIQYNKDWNISPCETFPPAYFAPKWLIQYNKDWNVHERAFNKGLKTAEMANPVQQGLKRVALDLRKREANPAEMANPVQQGLKLKVNAKNARMVICRNG